MLFQNEFEDHLRDFKCIILSDPSKDEKSTPASEYTILDL